MCSGFKVKPQVIYYFSNKNNGECILESAAEMFHVSWE